MADRHAPHIDVERHMEFLRNAFRERYGYTPDPATQEDVEDFGIFCAGFATALAMPPPPTCRRDE